MRRQTGNGSRYRHELKYLIEDTQHELLRMRIKELLNLDEHGNNGRYSIRSLYFDDYRNSAYEEKAAGIRIRRKYRIRFYDYSDTLIRLECKNRYDEYLNKESAPLTREESLRILDGDYAFLLNSPHELCRRFYVECMYRFMRPRVLVDYEREAWVHPGSGARVTFDMDVRVSGGHGMLFTKELPFLYVLEPGQIIMEVKYTGFLPSFLANILQTDDNTQISVSKYELCYQKLENPGGFHLWS